MQAHDPIEDDTEVLLAAAEDARRRNGTTSPEPALYGFDAILAGSTSPRPCLGAKRHGCAVMVNGPVWCGACYQLEGARRGYKLCRGFSTYGCRERLISGVWCPDCQAKEQRRARHAAERRGAPRYESRGASWMDGAEDAEGAAS